MFDKGVAVVTASTATSDVPESLLLAPAFREWLDSERVGTGAIIRPTRLAGGTQNTVIRFERGAESFVLRLAASSAEAGPDRIIMRETRLLRALASSSVPHPRLLAACDDRTLLGGLFYVMTNIQGFNAAEGLPAAQRNDPALRHKMGLALVDGLASIAAVDIQSAGLSEMGRSGNFLKRQVQRWIEQLEGYSKFSGWSRPEDISGLSELAEFLNKNEPSHYCPGLMHGDYHIGNVLYGTDGSLAAIIDWEMASIGDPLLDFARLLSTWPDANGDAVLSRKIEPWSGFPSRKELIDHYTGRSTRSVEHLLWFEVLACYKFAIIYEGTTARCVAGIVPRERGELLHQLAIKLIKRGHALIAQN
jgi:aminoglycoside phosphotransferase (APT) family kinase protein